MSATIYSTPLPEYVKSAALIQEQADAECSLSYKHDTDYQEFVESVQVNSQEYFETDVNERTLYGLWYKTRYFREHWRQPTKRADASMCWSAARFGLKENDILSIMFSWWGKHGRNVSQKEFDQWRERVLRRILKEVEPILKAYEEHKMERERGKLKNRIIEELKKARSTPKTLRWTLCATDDAIQGQLKRLVSQNIVRKVDGSWGLYELVECGN